MLENLDFYEGREQSWVKHLVLRSYLEILARIMGLSGRPSITYIDGFSGPWNVQSGSLSDSSFSIALSQLVKARDYLASKGRILRIRCVFIEKDVSAFSELSKFAERAKVRYGVEILTLNSEFEKTIPDLIRFIEADRDTFPFVFIDPKGWTGFSMECIAPLLRRQGEVLINFMLEFIRRFIEQDFCRESFSKLFGEDSFDSHLQDLKGIERDDEISVRYCKSLTKVCRFDFVHRAIILHPEKDHSHFQLIYGTRHPRGVEKFKEVEKKAMRAQDEARAKVEIEKKKLPLFDVPDMPESKYYVNLRNRYIMQAKEAVRSRLSVSKAVPYDDLWRVALQYPMVWESDLKDWFRTWREEGVIEVCGIQLGRSSIQYGKDHTISLLDSD